ncbi:MAG: phosphatase PAP2 family protein [Verrucomicrobiota bacterium]
MDERIFHLINEQWTSPALDLFMAVISRADIWTPFFIVAGLAILIFGGFRGRAFVFCTLLILGLSNLVVDPLKVAVGRPRPKQVQASRMIELIKTRPMLLTIWHRPIVRLSTEDERSRSGSSFPSGHTNNNTVIAICCMMFYRRWGALYWIIAAAVAYSRIYLAAHWPSDVVGTFFLAVGETLLLLGLLELFWSKWIAPRWPKLGHPHLLPFRAR